MTPIAANTVSVSIFSPYARRAPNSERQKEDESVTSPPLLKRSGRERLSPLNSPHLVSAKGRNYFRLHQIIESFQCGPLRYLSINQRCVG